MSLAKAITLAVLRRLAGDGGFVRAEEYTHRKQVRLESVVDGTVAAQVTAPNATHLVRLASEEGVLDYACDCPEGARGVFCEHCAAAGLAWLGTSGRTAKAGKPVKPAKITLISAIKAFVAEDRAKMAEALTEWAKSDPKLADRLLVRAAGQGNTDTAAATVQLLFNKAFRTLYSQERGRSPSRFLKELGQLVEPVEQLVKGSVPTAAVVAAVESCIDIVLKSPHRKDPTRGSTAVERLLNVHFQACAHVRPDPAAVGRKLLGWEVSMQLQDFALLPRYMEILGDRGAVGYREEAERVWETVAPAGMRYSGNYELRSVMTQIMLRLADYLGDIDLAITVRKQTMVGRDERLELAKFLAQAGRKDEALDLAEQACKDLPAYYRPPDVVNFMLDLQSQLRGSGAAAATAWQIFRDNCIPEQFILLRARIQRLGFDWAAECERAIAEVAAAAHARHQDQSALVEVLLASDQLERALREAESGSCSAQTWLKMALKFGAVQSPLEVDLYWKAAARAAEANDPYVAIQALRRAAAVMREAGKLAVFDLRFLQFRKTYSHRRTFRSTLDDAFGTAK